MSVGCEVSSRVASHRRVQRQVRAELTFVRPTALRVAISVTMFSMRRDRGVPSCPSGPHQCLLIGSSMEKLAVAGCALVRSVAGSGTAQVSPRPNELSGEERSAGWRLLFDGKTFTGWRGLLKNGSNHSAL